MVTDEQLTPADVAMMWNLAHGWIGQDCEVTLPSGAVVTGVDVARWAAAQELGKPGRRASVLRVFDGTAVSGQHVLPPGAVVRFGQRTLTIAPGSELMVGPTSETWELVDWDRRQPWWRRLAHAVSA